ncbi:MAG TPA: ABC transporter ATP-binding protein [Gemmataceae bacterium]|nr:ABC transporter ATP-binding protein [Gemmataceae bacterium]
MSTQLETAPPRAIAAVQPAPAEFVGVSKTYTHPLFKGWKVEALRDVSLRIEPGEVFGLLGPNRAGKTTLVKVLLSLCRPTGGQAMRLGAPVADRSTLARVGYVHENHAFPSYLTAAGLLEYYGALTLLPAEKVREQAPQLLKRFGLADRGREPIARYSKGMVQRLGLAQALLNEPQLLVLDEPTEGLDLDGRLLLREVVTEVRERGGSVLLISHVLNEVQPLCDRIGVMKGGRLLHVGTMDDFLEHPTKDRTRSLEQALQQFYLGERK